MKLDFIEKINEYGDNIVRLYEFDSIQAEKLRHTIQSVLIENKSQIAIHSLDFVQSRNCKLTLRISPEDFGIISEDNIQFYCDLTLASYMNILDLLKPFCDRETKGYQWLYDIDSQTDFLFSPAGTF